jgi:catechol 2,3-dioxygenase-like lactoylglutathione lyase family enzyme
MSIDHVAITTKDLAGTHRFYTEAVGFALVKVDVLDNPFGGWMRHALYDTGDGTILAVLEFNDDSMGEYRTDLSTGLGLPRFANHIAFGAHDLDALEAHRHRLLDHGHGCAVMDHHYTIALYTDDPNGITIEFSTGLRPLLTEKNFRLAQHLIHAQAPAINTGEPMMEFFDPAEPRSVSSDIVENARHVASQADLASQR